MSLTCDGPIAHLTMMTELGACLDPDNMKPYFFPVTNPQRKVYVFLDICHMAKNCRNIIGKGEVLIDGQGNKINWNYIVLLAKLQEREGLR